MASTVGGIHPSSVSSLDRVYEPITYTSRFKPVPTTIKPDPISSASSSLVGRVEPLTKASGLEPVSEPKSPYIIGKLKGKTLEKVLAQICEADKIANIANKHYLEYMHLTEKEQKKLVASLARQMVWEGFVTMGIGVAEGLCGIGEGFSAQVSGAFSKVGGNLNAKTIESACKTAAPVLKRSGDAYSLFGRSRQTELDMARNNLERIVQGRILEAMGKLSQTSNQYNTSATAILNANTRAQA